jgi:hypothetical protein
VPRSVQSLGFSVLSRVGCLLDWDEGTVMGDGVGIHEQGHGRLGAACQKVV